MTSGIDIPGYSLIRQIGGRGPVAVHLASQVGLDRRVAIRTLRTGLDDGAPDLVEAFESEGRDLARIRHRNIVQVYEIGATDDIRFRVMEHLDGGTLLDHMRAGRLGPAQVIEILADVVRALQAAHLAGVFHDDLRPSGIMFRADGAAVLTDFGRVRNLASSPDDTATGVGDRTPRYLSPEQLQGKQADARSNVYSLGLLLQYLITGEFPSRGLVRESGGTSGSGVDSSLVGRDFTDLQPVIARMMAQDRDARYADMGEVLEGLAPLMPEQADLSDPSFAVPAKARRHRPGFSPGKAALAGLLIVAVSAYLAYRSMPTSLGENDQQAIERELIDFETYMARMAIYGPENANATAAVERMLAISRDAPDVVTAAGRLADIYLDDAYDSYRRGTLDDATRLVARGLALSPNHDGLMRLDAELSKAREQARIADLIDQGRGAMSQGNFLPPGSPNAYDLFRSVQSIDPDNPEADSGLREIQIYLAEQARAAWVSDGSKAAETLTRRGLALFPDSFLLRDLNADLERAKSTD